MPGRARDQSSRRHVCTHTERATIDATLLEGIPLRNIAERYGLSATALFRHRAEHIPAELIRAQEAAQAAQADDLLGQLRTLQTRCLAILEKAEKAEDYRTSIMAIREARSNLELLAKLLHQLNESPSIAIVLAPEWATVRAALFAALAPFPEARVAVAEQLSLLEMNGARN
jgi:hypothetical protein